MQTEWPPLPFDEWKDTCDTLHMWTQVVGKIRLVLAPMVNHWWNATLYVTCCGLTTSPIPIGRRNFQIDFDFIDHKLQIITSDGRTDSFPLVPMTVADFYKELMGRLRALDIYVKIWTHPCEVPDPVPFENDTVHAAYNPAQVTCFFEALVTADRLFKEFRAGFIGKVSPVHFFWGSFDLAVTRFSGRTAPPHPGAPNIALDVVQEAYSHEVSSCGFWPGNGGFGQAAFYAYAYPAAPGFADAPVKPPGVFNKDLGEFILPYEAARQSAAPDKTVLDFLQSTYEAAAVTGKWDRVALERKRVA